MDPRGGLDAVKNKIFFLLADNRPPGFPGRTISNLMFFILSFRKTKLENIYPL